MIHLHVHMQLYAADSTDNIVHIKSRESLLIKIYRVYGLENMLIMTLISAFIILKYRYIYTCIIKHKSFETQSSDMNLEIYCRVILR